MENLVKEALESLRGLRSNMHDKVDTSTIQAFDDALYKLEKLAAKKQWSTSSTLEVLSLCGKALEILPVIKAILERLGK